MGISASPQPYPWIDSVGQGLGKARAWMNNARVPQSVPLIGGQGAGDMVIGQSPEELKEWSYGNAPYQMTPQGVQVPQLKMGRGDGVMSTVFLADQLGGLAGLGAKGLKAGVQGATNAAMNVGENAGRREFLKKAGLATATAAAPMGVLKLAEKAAAKGGLKDAAMDVAGTAGRAVAEDTARAAAHPWLAGFKKLNVAGEHLSNDLRGSEAFHAPALKQAEKGDYAEWMSQPGNRDELEAWTRRQQHFEDIHGGDSGEPHPFYEMAPEEAYSRTNAVRERMSADADTIRAHHEGVRRGIIDEHPGIMSTNDVFTAAKDAGHDWETAKALSEAHGRQYGALPDHEAEAVLRKGGSYTDPENGLQAVLNEHGDMQWFSPRTGSTGRYQHWTHDDHLMPDAHVYDPTPAPARAPRQGFDLPDELPF